MINLQLKAVCAASTPASLSGVDCNPRPLLFGDFPPLRLPLSPYSVVDKCTEFPNHCWYISIIAYGSHNPEIFYMYACHFHFFILCVFHITHPNITNLSLYPKTKQNKIDEKNGGGEERENLIIEAVM